MTFTKGLGAWRGGSRWGGWGEPKWQWQRLRSLRWVRGESGSGVSSKYTGGPRGPGARRGRRNAGDRQATEALHPGSSRKGERQSSQEAVCRDKSQPVQMCTARKERTQG